MHQCSTSLQQSIDAFDSFQNDKVFDLGNVLLFPCPYSRKVPLTRILVLYGWVLDSEKRQLEGQSERDDTCSVTITIIF